MSRMIADRVLASVMAVVALLLVLWSMANHVIEGSSRAVPPKRSTSVQAERPVFEVLNWAWSDLGRKVAGSVIIVNRGGRPGAPLCFAQVGAIGFFEPSDPVELGPGEERELHGTFHFPIPVFNYETDSEQPVNCYSSPEGIPSATRQILEFEDLVCGREAVTVPDIGGRRLFEVGYPLMSRCLHVRLSGVLRGMGSEEELLNILHNLILKKGPRVDTYPPPGTRVAPRSIVKLVPAEA